MQWRLLGGHYFSVRTLLDKPTYNLFYPSKNKLMTFMVILVVFSLLARQAVVNCSTLTSPSPAGLISSQAFFAIKGELSLLFSTARRSPTTRSSSSLSIYPLRLISKNLKICLRFSSGDPEDIT